MQAIPSFPNLPKWYKSSWLNETFYIFSETTFISFGHVKKEDLLITVWLGFNIHISYIDKLKNYYSKELWGGRYCEYSLFKTLCTPKNSFPYISDGSKLALTTIKTENIIIHVIIDVWEFLLKSFSTGVIFSIM